MSKLAPAGKAGVLVAVSGVASYPKVPVSIGTGAEAFSDANTFWPSAVSDP